MQNFRKSNGSNISENASENSSEYSNIFRSKKKNSFMNLNKLYSDIFN